MTFNWIFLAALWVFSGFVGWRLKVKHHSNGRATNYDMRMLLPCLIIGPINLVLALIYI